MDVKKAGICGQMPAVVASKVISRPIDASFQASSTWLREPEQERGREPVQLPEPSLLRRAWQRREQHRKRWSRWSRHRPERCCSRRERESCSSCWRSGREQVPGRERQRPGSRCCRWACKRSGSRCCRSEPCSSGCGSSHSNDGRVHRWRSRSWRRPQRTNRSSSSCRLLQIRY